MHTNKVGEEVGLFLLLAWIPWVLLLGPEAAALPV